MYNLTSNGVSLTQQCSEFKNWTTEERNVADTLGQIERFFDCSLWC
jgi:hypothetical protein